MPVGTGRTLGVANATSASKFVTMNYIATLATQKFFIAPFPLVLTAIQGVPRVAGSGGACTLAFYKAGSGVAVGDGVLMHSGTYDMVGTADINQDLTLVPDQTLRQFAAGDSIGYALTGTATSAIGSITVTFEPLS